MVSLELRVAAVVTLATVPRGEAARYSVGSPTPAAAKPSRRSRHLLHSPQCLPPAGFMHDIVSSNGTPSDAPSAITSSLCIAENGASIAIGCARPLESVCAIDARNSGVASGNGLPASGPMAMRGMPRSAQRTPAFASSSRFRPGR